VARKSDSCEGRLAVRVSDTGAARAVDPGKGRGPGSESLRRTNPWDNGEQSAGYGDLLGQRRWRGMVLRRLVRVKAADDGGARLASVAESLIEE
jgi:hypothetical protein